MSSPRVCRLHSKDKSVNPDTFARLSRRFSEREICEIVWLVASEHVYNMTNLGLNIHSDMLCKISHKQEWELGRDWRADDHSFSVTCLRGPQNRDGLPRPTAMDFDLRRAGDVAGAALGRFERGAGGTANRDVGVFRS
jgi:hypothetical protein